MMNTDHRLKLTKRPMIKVGTQFKSDHNIFGEPSEAETPHRMRKAVEVIEVQEDPSVLKVGRRHIDEPCGVADDRRKGFSDQGYDPSRSDRFQSTRRFTSSGNVITGELPPDSFEVRKPVRACAEPVSVQRSTDHIKHAPEDAPAFKARAEHANSLKQRRAYCPFAVDDGYNAPEAPIKPHHQLHIDHGDVLTGGAMAPQFAGRRF
ncbi:hypothetical protein DIPPA_11580 [Diplonema papillatum]|nr:hypothetical protein DIPPA_11580 [Diplonema papillatum]